MTNSLSTRTIATALAIGIIAVMLAGLSALGAKYLAARIFDVDKGKDWSPLVLHSKTVSGATSYCFDNGTDYCESKSFSKESVIGWLIDSSNLSAETKTLYSCEMSSNKFHLTTNPSSTCTGSLSSPYLLGRTFTDSSKVPDHPVEKLTACRSSSGSYLSASGSCSAGEGLEQLGYIPPAGKLTAITCQDLQSACATAPSTPACDTKFYSALCETKTGSGVIIPTPSLSPSPSPSLNPSPSPSTSPSPSPSPTLSPSPSPSPSLSPSPSPSPSLSISPSPSASPPPSPSPSLSPSTPAAHTIFVTSGRYKVGPKGFTGLSGADQVCQAESQSAGLTGNFKAILSDRSTNAKDRLTIIGPIKNTKDELIANSSADLWDGSLLKAIFYTPSGTNPPFVFTWSGTNDDGNKYEHGPRSDFCTDWTRDWPSIIRAGNNYVSDARWIRARNVSCRASFPLYCISQTSPNSSPLPPPSPSPSLSPSTPAAHTIFVTSGRYKVGPKGFTGLSGADQVCQAESQSAGLTGNFKAILSDRSTNAKDRLTIIGPIKNTKDELIANSSADLWDGSLLKAIFYTPSGTNPPFVFTWSGTNDDGNKYEHGPRSDFCTDWTRDWPSIIRAGNNYVSDARWIRARNVSCRASFPLYCISQ